MRKGDKCMKTKKKNESKKALIEPVKIAPLPWVVGPLTNSALKICEAVKQGKVDEEALRACHYLLSFCATLLLSAGWESRPGAMVLPIGQNGQKKNEVQDVSLGDN